MNLFKSTKATTYISSRGDKVYPIVMDIKTGIVEGKAVFTTGDIDTAYLYTTILEEQSDYNILGSTVICNIQRPDGTTMKIQGDVQGNNLIEFPLGQSGVSQEGIYNFDIAVVLSEKKMVTSPTAQYSVTQSIEVDGELVEDDRFPVLEGLINELKVIKDEELVRVSNEEDRLANETVRQNQEVTRSNQEQARVTAEGNRVTSENVRVSAEQARVLKEQERQAIEVERQNSESTREQQEATRVSQENARKQADILRQQEHESRQQFLNGFEGKLNTVVDDVATIKDDVVSVREANKRQDIFLQGLYNENLDGRVTLKEEGSVISLTNSDDGLVDIVGLEGNTLVNYVADGAKELTLNGDIAVEGASVILTEGVDNGLVDVALEGNTIINCLATKIEGNINFVANGTAQYYYYRTIPKGNTVYTLVANIVKNTINSNFSLIGWQITHDNKQCRIPTGFVGTFKQTFTTKEDVGSDWYMDFWKENTIGEIEFNNFMILEGDWTNKEIPAEYFEGMKSVGECEDNKIEILSRNKNLFDGELELGSISTSHGGDVTHTECLRSKNYIKVRPNTTIIQSNDLGYASVVNVYDKDKNLIAYLGSKNPFTIPENGEYIRFRSSTGNSENNLNVKYQFEEGSVATSYVPHTTNKKEITLSEPLRALPNGVKDKIVKIGDKWYVERNCGEVLLNGNEDWKLANTYTSTYKFAHWVSTLPKAKSQSNNKDQLSNRLIISNPYMEIKNSVWIYGTQVRLFLDGSQTTIEEFKQWLQENPTKVVYQLETPIYEEITDPTVNTYNDKTHISNNSTIPCNMTVKNTGYNAIIKPSTQYTVAFDTDKSGTIGINLGGTKVTTTNNVATITTPSTLVDDSLRLTGKGIKASKVRLLEGDKTNWIPSFFEGMKSSFEEQVEEDKYKIEILMNNKNLLGELSIGGLYGATGKDDVSATTWRKTDFVAIGKNHRNVVHTSNNADSKYLFQYNSNKKMIGAHSTDDNITLLDDCAYIRTCYKDYNGTQYQLELGNIATNYTPRKQNKIKLLINEPLRGVGDVKDRFVFKDGKLMIERNCIERDLTYFNFGTTEIKGNNFKAGHRLDDIYIQPNGGSNINIKCNKLASAFMEDIIPCISVYHHGDNNELRVSIPQYLLETLDREGVNKYFANNLHKITYQLAEPTYEEIPLEAQKLILEGYVNGTLFLDTNIPPTVEVNYTANIPVVNELNKNSNEIVVTQEDLSVTQIAVDFLLMSNLGEEMLSSFNINTRGRNSMGAYFANRITKGALKYEDVISKYPQYKEEIDSILETK